MLPASILPVLKFEPTQPTPSTLATIITELSPFSTTTVVGDSNGNDNDNLAQFRETIVAVVAVCVAEA